MALKMDQKGQKWIARGYNEPKSTFIVVAIFGPKITKHKRLVNVPKGPERVKNSLVLQSYPL